MKLSTNVKPVSYLKGNVAQVIKDVTSTQSPLVITQRGEAKVVVQDVKSYEQLQDGVALLKILALSMSQLRQGQVKPLKKALADIEKSVRA